MQRGASCQHEPVAEAEERTECVSEHRDLVPAPPQDGGSWGRNFTLGGKMGWG